MKRNLAVFSDGTGQTAGHNDSNVLRLLKLLDLEAGDQLAIYDPGIGTHATRNRVEAGLQVPRNMRLADLRPNSNPLRGWLAPLELGFGLGMRANLRQLYTALVQEYRDGDDLYLFGFSRGAFTVRALAGLLYRCGLPRTDESSIIDEALHWYGSHYTGMAPEARAFYRARVDAFRRAHCRPCNIRFLGVWDTVKSVGYFNPVNLPHMRHNPAVRSVRHALALDERRSFYLPTTWGGLCGDTRPAVQADASFDLDMTDKPKGEPQDVQEVWFPGNHSDVGGGYQPNERVPARNSLRWMIAEARHCGLRFDPQRYRKEYPAETDEKVTYRHDEMKDKWYWRVVWWLADRSPRLELQNEPPPPRKNFKFRPAGSREVAKSLRGLPGEKPGTVSIHESARGLHDEADPIWRGLPENSSQYVSTRTD